MRAILQHAAACWIRYFHRFRQLAEVRDVLLVRLPGRETISNYIIGIAWRDIYSASRKWLWRATAIRSVYSRRKKDCG